MQTLRAANRDEHTPGAMVQGSTAFAHRFRILVVVSVLVVFGLALLWSYLSSTNEGPSYAYSSMLADARDGKVESISQDKLRLSVAITGEPEPRTVLVASNAINVYDEVCAAAGKEPGPDCPILFEVTQDSQGGETLVQIIFGLLPVLLIGSFIYFMMGRAQQQQK